MKRSDFNNRNDVRLQEDSNLQNRIKSFHEAKITSDRKAGNNSLKNISNFRKVLVEHNNSDPNGFERILNESDLLSVNFLTRGIEAAKSVCRIRVPVRGGWYGTGFLVGPNLMMTNNHVISDKREASQCEVEFNYEHDKDGVLKHPIGFNLHPDDIFFTSKDLDVTFVSISTNSNAGIPIERFGYLRLLPISGKGLPGEWVTIIQHPNGDPKQMTIRENQILEGDSNDAPKKFIHYTTDTDPGSSGSPVLNDQWQVVAIHHKAVPNPDSDNDEIEFIANEGVRISAIFTLLESSKFSDLQASKVLERLSIALGIVPIIIDSSRPFLRDKTIEPELEGFSLDYWEGHQTKLGYDSDFLNVNIDLEEIISPVVDSAARLKDDSSNILDYLHFSAVIHKERKFPLITAVNIFGEKLTHPGSRSDNWRRDKRMDYIYQPGDNFYKRTIVDEAVYFSRGHLVRRFDPCWGTQEEAEIAEQHTFHFTNAAPQYQRFNNVEWGDLEDYVLDKTQTTERKVSIFTGPVFKESDPSYGFQRENGPWQIPVSYWKIAVAEKSDGSVSAAGFMVGQIEYIEDLYESKIFTGLNPYTFDELITRRIQVPIELIEEITGLDFTSLKDLDAANALESTRRTRIITRADDIII